MKDLKIEALQKNEEGLLTGGFSSLEIASANPSGANFNCSEKVDPSARNANGNCGCNDCRGKREENPKKENPGGPKKDLGKL